MNTEKLELSEVRLPERNVRKHPEHQIKEFMRSLEMFGQTRPLVIDEENVILIGNGMFLAMQKLGWTHADALRRSDLSEQEKKKLMIADNKIFSLGVDDLDTTNEFINELLDFDVPGFDEELLRMMTADAEEVTERIAEYGTLDEEEVSRIRSREVPEVPQGTNLPPTPMSGTNEPSQSQDAAQVTSEAERGRYIICPKCGEKIWL